MHNSSKSEAEGGKKCFPLSEGLGVVLLPQQPAVFCYSCGLHLNLRRAAIIIQGNACATFGIQLQVGVPVERAQSSLFLLSLFGNSDNTLFLLGAAYDVIFVP